MDQYHYAQIGMAHIIVCILFYMAAFIGVFVIINLVKLQIFIKFNLFILIQKLYRVRYLMSINTRAMHYMLFKSLIAQVIDNINLLLIEYF